MQYVNVMYYVHSYIIIETRVITTKAFIDSTTSDASSPMAYQGVPSLSSAAANARTALGPASSHNNPVEKEQQCVLHWFQGWSAFQRQNFLQFLLERAVPHSVDSLFEAMDSLKVRDTPPPTIFQCQLKLMGEWFSEWTDKERNDLMTWLAARDPAFVERFNEEVLRAGGGGGGGGGGGEAMSLQ